MHPNSAIPLPLQAEAERSQLAEELAAERERLQGEAQQVGGVWRRCGQAGRIATAVWRYWPCLLECGVEPTFLPEPPSLSAAPGVP